jgi:uncharacterized protein (UPF0332 family)
MRIGFKSEIHDCSIALAKLLAKNGILGDSLLSDISNSKQIRIDSQYYVGKEYNQKVIEKTVKNARKFVLEIEKIIEKITTNQIENIREQIKALL